MTSLHVAAKKGENLEIVIKLIGQGTDINIQDDNGVSETILLISAVYIFCCLRSFIIFCCLKSFISLRSLKQMSPT